MNPANQNNAVKKSRPETTNVRKGEPRPDGVEYKKVNLAARGAVGALVALFEEKSEIIDEMIQDFREHFREGPKAFVKDGQLNGWGFYESEDINTPARIGGNKAGKLKDAVFREYKDETHMTLFDKYGDDVSTDNVEH
ncbi:hypothetical protein B0A49_12723 [Cryomyces minteri]|uniref:Uncharacterized protein n=1 Tax=Cryomyces minteri TaxID=331657 RepID=A0A4U0VGJ2_9PEZI|nr:hypothetical protein B0A49_12723 [Cryomyces minteri]